MGDAGAVYTAFDVWPMKQGIAFSHSRPCQPQTQDKNERFHRTSQQGQQFDDLTTTQAAFARWRDIYNHERSHQALDMTVPGKRYQSSVQTCREHPPEPEHGDMSPVKTPSKGEGVDCRTFESSHDLAPSPCTTDTSFGRQGESGMESQRSGKHSEPQKAP